MNSEKLILLSGNPNVGKSSIFNLLTGMNQHTGNWSGKTVSTQIGKCKKNKDYLIIDLPGTYSLISTSEEEKLARDSVLFDDAYKNIIVVDSCFLERNLNLVLQILEANRNAVLCLNLSDELKKKKIEINCELLSEMLDIPVIMCSAKDNHGIDELILSFENKQNSNYALKYSDELESIIEEITKFINAEIDDVTKRFVAIKLLEGDESIVESFSKRKDINITNSEITEFVKNINKKSIRKEISIYRNNEAERIVSKCAIYKKKNINYKTKKIDRIVCSKKYGIIINILILFFLLYLTITFSNYPSQLLSKMFSFFEKSLLNFSTIIGVPKIIYEPLILGIFKTVGWVVSVMFPPMAIFFPLFSLAEECGFLPRIAFNSDKVFNKYGAHGKQALTMCMGLGCNACGILGSRIIDSPRDKLTAILTNNFIPCNGRFPLIITLISLFFVTSTNFFASNLLSALILSLLIIFSIIITLLVSLFLSKTILKGKTSYFTLEMPVYRKPKILQVVLRSFLDKTLYILFKAIKVCAPAGLIVWLITNININNISILTHISTFLDPFASLFGLTGIIFIAFFLALPANEIVLPIILMYYLSTGYMIEVSNANILKEILVNNGWTFMTALSVSLFSIMHFPCGTTLLTIKKEVGTKWMMMAFIIPTIVGLIILFVINTIVKIII